MGDWGGGGEEEIFGPATYLTQRPLRTQRNTGGGDLFWDVEILIFPCKCGTLTRGIRKVESGRGIRG